MNNVANLRQWVWTSSLLMKFLDVVAHSLVHLFWRHIRHQTDGELANHLKSKTNYIENKKTP